MFTAPTPLPSDPGEGLFQRDPGVETPGHCQASPGTAPAPRTQHARTPTVCRLCGVPTGQTRIARRFNAGITRLEVPSPEGTADSVPQIPVVILDTMLLQQCDKLLFECHFAMMSLLAFD